MSTSTACGPPTGRFAERHAGDDGVTWQSYARVGSQPPGLAPRIVVIDHGEGFRAGSTQEGLGAGMRIMAQCADAFAIRERLPSGTEVWLRFDLT